MYFFLLEEAIFFVVTVQICVCLKEKNKETDYNNVVAEAEHFQSTVT
jgi:hypothetical protein